MSHPVDLFAFLNLLLPFQLLRRTRPVRFSSPRARAKVLTLPILNRAIDAGDNLINNPAISHKTKHQSKLKTLFTMIKKTWTGGQAFVR
ncbi:hypothetical protein BT96DRAFT_527463 [Gymnopus androsaceus JB14]|uniref:Secreted protein n=1 Tax=Gymnopus androsaceus JB14 TaxID=1447944 RepID=A0A6A4IHR0_9AGAR|nr:hypothetical protein BT96DRAFT_527463 [Gymnopus androsaceus JB14]